MLVNPLDAVNRFSRDLNEIAYLGAFAGGPRVLFAEANARVHLLAGDAAWPASFF
jgi:hypothetical protein